MPRDRRRAAGTGVRGVSVERRRGPRGDLYIGRYTLPTGQRPSLPSRPSWQAAFDAARAQQDKVDRARYRDPGGARMTFTELVEEHYLPMQVDVSPVTRKNIRSHLGDGTGRPRAQGGKGARAARHQLLTVFGHLPIEQIGPQDVRGWQASMLREHYGRNTMLVKRGLLRTILELARVNGWLELNPVDPVPPPRARQRPDDDRVLTPAEWSQVRRRPRR